MQSFDFSSLEKLSTLTDLPLIYLFNSGSVAELDTQNELFTWKDWIKWEDIARICYGIGPAKTLIAVKTSKTFKFISDLVEGLAYSS